MAKKQNIAICDGCGRRRPIVARGLCKKCYNDQYRAEQRKKKLVQAYGAIGAIQKVIGQPAEALLDEMFYCGRYHCWMRVQHCLAYHDMAVRVENGDTDTGIALRRDMCLDCAQYDSVLQAVERNDVAALKIYGQDKIKQQKQTKQAEVRQPEEQKTGNQNKVEVNETMVIMKETVAETPTVKAPMGTVKLPDQPMADQPMADQPMADQRIPTKIAHVDDKYGICLDCGKRPASNPISHLCGKCHAAMQVRQRKEKILKTLEMSWFDVAMVQYPELRKRIVEKAKSEYRTPELQVLYMLDMLMRSIDNTMDTKEWIINYGTQDRAAQSKCTDSEVSNTGRSVL